MPDFSTNTPKIELVVEVLANGDVKNDIYEINAKGQTSYKSTHTAPKISVQASLDAAIIALTPV